jgi:hypothetical protein
MERLKRAAKTVMRRLGIPVTGRAKGFIIPSAEKGRALLTTRAYAAGERLLPVEGALTLERGTWTLQVGPASHLEPEPPLGFANHSCDPNSGFLVAPDGTVWLAARRALRKGDEVCFDYAMAEADFDEKGVPKSFPCRCGAGRCRGVVEKGWSGLSEALKAEYRPWAMPYLRAR